MLNEKKTLANINVLFNARNNAIKFIEDYGSMILEAKKQAKQEGKGLKILTPKQMLQRLPIALAQTKAGNDSESVLSEVRQIVYSLCQSKEITKKIYNNIIKSIKVQYKMDTIFMNSKNSRTSEYHVLVLKPTEKLDVKRGQKRLSLLNLSIYYPWKNIKSSYKKNKLKISVPTLTILNIFLRNIVKMLIIHQSEYM